MRVTSSRYVRMMILLVGAACSLLPGCRSTGGLARLPGMGWMASRDATPQDPWANAEPSQGPQPPSIAAVPQPVTPFGKEGGTPTTAPSNSVASFDSPGGYPNTGYPQTSYATQQVSGTNASSYDTGPYKTGSSAASFTQPAPAATGDARPAGGSVDTSSQQGFYNPNYAAPDDGSSFRGAAAGGERRFAPDNTRSPAVDYSADNYVSPSATVDRGESQTELGRGSSRFADDAFNSASGSYSSQNVDATSRFNSSGSSNASSSSVSFYEKRSSSSGNSAGPSAATSGARSAAPWRPGSTSDYSTEADANSGDQQPSYSYPSTGFAPAPLDTSKYGNDETDRLAARYRSNYRGPLSRDMLGDASPLREELVTSYSVLPTLR